MEIKKLVTENFKACPDGTYQFGKVNVLIGPNGKGKTSLQNALRYVLTGKLPEDPIRHGEDHVTVSAVLDDGQNTTIERTNYVADTWRINGEEVKEKDFTAEVLKNRDFYERSGKLLAVNRAHTNRFFYNKDQSTLWDFLQNGRVEGSKITGLKELEVELEDGTVLYLIRSKPSNARIDGKTSTGKAVTELLRDRIGGEPKGLELVTSSEVFQAMHIGDFGRYLMSMVPVQLDFEKLSQLAKLTKDERDVLSPLFPPSPSPVTPGDVASVHKLLMATRQGITKRMEELRAKAQFEGQLPPLTQENVDKKIKEINGQLAAYDQLKQAWDVYKKRVEERRKSISTLREWIEKYNSFGHVDNPTEGELQKLLAQETEIRSRIMQNEKQAVLLQQSNVPLKKMLDNLDTKVCPLCDKLVCSTDKTGAKKDLADAIEANEAASVLASQTAEKDKKALEQLLADEERVRNNVSRFNEKLALYNQIEDFKKSIPDEPKMPAPLQEPAGLTEELQKYSEYKRQYLLYDECKKSLADYEKVKIQHMLYTSLVRKSEPKNGLLTVTILDYLLTPFADHVNHFAKGIYGDTELQFKMADSGLQVLCKPHGRDCFLPVNVLSRGEAMLATFALMDMVSSISNARMLMFDNLESLDEESLGKLISMFQTDEMLSQYDHIFLSMVGHGSITDVVEKFPVTVLNF